MDLPGNDDQPKATGRADCENLTTWLIVCTIESTGCRSMGRRFTLDWEWVKVTRSVVRAFGGLGPLGYCSL